MPTLTRRRLNERFESWGIFYGDVKVGGLSETHGLGSSMIWQWSCGFYPGCGPRQQSAGNEDTFEDAKAAFQNAWQRLQPQITTAMLDEWRHQRDFTAWKYAMWDAGCRLPTQSTTGKSRCFCGIAISSDSIEPHIYDHHAGTKQSADA